MKLRWLCLTLVVVPLWVEQAPAQTFKQSYFRVDGKVVPTDSKELWLKKSAKGLPDYLVCQYSATEKNGVIVRRDWVIYFPNGPVGADTDRCNWWVYWYNEKTGKIWGRCPTPNHRDFKTLAQQAKGNDLWQVIPKDRQVAGFETQLQRLPELARDFGEVFSTEAKRLPRVRADIEDVIQCVDFTNPVFR
jgi:hypothetical protein